MFTPGFSEPARGKFHQNHDRCDFDGANIQQKVKSVKCQKTIGDQNSPYVPIQINDSKCSQGEKNQIFINGIGPIRQQYVDRNEDQPNHNSKNDNREMIALNFLLHRKNVSNDAKQEVLEQKHPNYCPQAISKIKEVRLFGKEIVIFQQQISEKTNVDKKEAVQNDKRQQSRAFRFPKQLAHHVFIQKSAVGFYKK